MESFFLLNRQRVRDIVDTAITMVIRAGFVADTDERAQLTAVQRVRFKRVDGVKATIGPTSINFYREGQAPFGTASTRDLAKMAAIIANLPPVDSASKLEALEKT